MGGTIPESEFYMWRTLFATAHADNKVTGEEIRFMAEALEDNAFSPEQNKILLEDIRTAQDIATMFRGITDVRDQARFFELARKLVWVDGDYGEEEQAIMLKLQKAHIATVDVAALIGKTKLKLED